MANNEIHIKDFYDTEEGYQWLSEVSAEYSKQDWNRVVEVRLLSNGTVQIMASFKRVQPELFESE